MTAEQIAMGDKVGLILVAFVAVWMVATVFWLIFMPSHS